MVYACGEEGAAIVGAVPCFCKTTGRLGSRLQGFYKQTVAVVNRKDNVCRFVPTGYYGCFAGEGIGEGGEPIGFLIKLVLFNIYGGVPFVGAHVYFSVHDSGIAGQIGIGHVVQNKLRQIQRAGIYTGRFRRQILGKLLSAVKQRVGIDVGGVVVKMVCTGTDSYSFLAAVD